MTTGTKKKVFMTSGCFLFFHEGHRELLDYLIDLADGESIIVATNTREYLLNKYPEKLNDLLDKISDPVLKLEEELKLTDQFRSNEVQAYIGSSGQVVVSDDVLELIDREKHTIIWVVGDDYINKLFQERQKVDYLYITPRSTGNSSKQILEHKLRR